MARLEEHALLWRAKPTLRAVYRVWFDALLDVLPSRARVIEVGAGPGFLAGAGRERRPDLRWIATELARARWNDLVADAHHLPFADGAADAVVGFDVLHHLARPGDFFAEAARVTRSGGRLAFVEPWVTAASYVLYRFFHQERCTWSCDPWDPFADAGGHEKDMFEGNATVLPLLVRRTAPARWRSLGLEPPRLTLFNGLAYVLTLGFRRGSLLPAALTGAALGLDRACAALRPLMALRALAVWDRAPRAADDR